MLKRVRSPTRPTPPSRAIKDAVLVCGCVKSTHSTISSESRCQAHSQIRGSRWLLRVFSGWLRFGWSALARPSAYISLRSLGSASYKAAPAGRTMHDGRTLQCCVRCSETLLHCALNRRTGSRVAAWTDRASFSVESFGVANGFLRLTCCRVINLVLGVTRSSSRSPYNHAALLSADFEKHVLRLQAQL